MNNIFTFKASNADDIIIIDLEDKERVFLHNTVWSISKKKRGFIKSVNTINCRSKILHKKIPLARLVLDVIDKNLDKDVDHIDCNRLNNSKSNLRLLSRKDNCRRVLVEGGTSKYRGVHWHKNLKKWQVKIQTDCGSKYIGIFINEIDAAKAYNEAAIKYHGRFAILNSFDKPEKKDNPDGLKEVKI